MQSYNLCADLQVDLSLRGCTCDIVRNALLRLRYSKNWGMLERATSKVCLRFVIVALTGLFCYFFFIFARRSVC